MTKTDIRETDPVRAAFDAAFYLRANPDVAAAGVDAFDHFMIHGWREGRAPSAGFSPAAYLEANPDVAAAGINAFHHFIIAGRAEGRPLRTDLGFRQAILTRAVPLEDRVRTALATRRAVEPSPDEHLARAIESLAGKRRLHVTVGHDDFTATLGGVQLCLAREADALRTAGVPHLHLHPATPSPVPDFESDRPLLGVMLDGVGIGRFAAPVIARTLERQRAAVEISFAVHSFIGHDIGGISAILEASGAHQGFYWVHDFSSVCANHVLLRNDVAFCGAPPPDSPACGICDYGERRRISLADHAAFFRHFAITVLAPSESALALWRSASPHRPIEARVHPHATLRARPPGTPRPAGGTTPLRVAFLGLPVPHKGWPVFASLVARFHDDPRYAFFHLGKCADPAVAAHFERVEPSATDPAPMRAAVERLAIDIAIIWSLCPETFSFVTYEAVAGGAALVTSPDAGNVAHVVAERRCGIVLADERALERQFESGEILGLGRGSAHDLAYSGMTADFVLEPAR